MSGQTTRKGALLDSGTPSPNPWDLSLSRQNGCSTMEALERRIGLRRNATRAPIQGPEWQGAGFPSRPQNSTPRPRRALAYCGQKMVLTMGSTLDITDAKSIPQELQRIVPENPSLPVRPLILSSQYEYAMFKDFLDYPWVLTPYRYKSLEELLVSLEDEVIAPAINKAQEIEKRRRAVEQELTK